MMWLWEKISKVPTTNCSANVDQSINVIYVKECFAERRKQFNVYCDYCSKVQSNTLSLQVSAVRLVTSPSKSPGATQEQGASCQQSLDTITGEEMLILFDSIFRVFMSV